MAQHLITLNCGTSYQLVQKLDGQIYEGQVIKGNIILTPAHRSSEWSWDSEVDVLHLYLEPALVAKKELLQAGEMAISEIATAVGFYDQSHLRSFQAHCWSLS